MVVNQTIIPHTAAKNVETTTSNSSFVSSQLIINQATLLTKLLVLMSILSRTFVPCRRSVRLDSLPTVLILILSGLDCWIKIGKTIGGCLIVDDSWLILHWIDYWISLSHVISLSGICSLVDGSWLMLSWDKR